MASKKSLLISLMILVGLLFAGCSSKVVPEEEVKVETVEVAEIEKEAPEKSEEEVQLEKLGMMIADGVYTEEITYLAPSNTTDILTLNMEVKDNVVHSLSLEAVEVHMYSEGHINNVNEELQTLVVGKNLNDVEIPEIISGASLTTKAFNEKLNEISNN